MLESLILKIIVTYLLIILVDIVLSNFLSLKKKRKEKSQKLFGIAFKVYFYNAINFLIIGYFIIIIWKKDVINHEDISIFKKFN